jgi:hypothetical protein
MAHRILLLKCHESHHVSLRRCGGRKILRHVAGCELHRHHQPLAHEVLQVHLCDLRRDPVLFHHGSRGKEKQCSLSPKNLPILSLSFQAQGRKRGDNS